MVGVAYAGDHPSSCRIFAIATYGAAYTVWPLLSAWKMSNCLFFPDFTFSSVGGLSIMRPPRRGGRVAEGAPLLREYTSKGCRGFESPLLRHYLKARSAGLFFVCSLDSVEGVPSLYRVGDMLVSAAVACSGHCLVRLMQHVIGVEQNRLKNLENFPSKC